MSQALKEHAMTTKEFQRAYDNYELETEFADYLINKVHARIGNGDMLIEARESGLYDEGFEQYMTGA